MNETSRSHSLRVFRRDYERFLKSSSIGIDIGGESDPLRNPSGQPYPTFSLNDAKFLGSLKTETIDFIYSCNVLNRIDGLEMTLNNWNRVLKRGGIVYISLPDFINSLGGKFSSDTVNTFSLTWSRQNINRDNHYGPGELYSLFERCGFRVLRIEVEDFDLYPQGYSEVTSLTPVTGQFSVVLIKPEYNSFIPRLARVPKEEYENFIVDFNGGLGDVITTIYRTDRYVKLDSITKKVNVLLRSHNPFSIEFFTYHPKRHLMMIHDLSSVNPGKVNNFMHMNAEVSELCSKLGLDVSDLVPDADYFDYDITPEKVKKVNLYTSVNDNAILSCLKGKRYVVVQPNAGSRERVIPEEVMHDLLDACIKRKVTPVLIGKNYFRALSYNPNDPTVRTEHVYERDVYSSKHKGVISLIDSSITAPGTIELIKSSKGYFGTYSSMVLGSWYNRVPTIALYSEATKEVSFKGPDQWNIGKDYPETRHGLYSEFKREWVDELIC